MVQLFREESLLQRCGTYPYRGKVSAMASPAHSTVPVWTLGDRLRKAREHAGLTVDEMAEVLEVSDRTVRNYENDVSPIKRPAIRSWGMRCGGGDVVHWIINGEAPGDGGEPSTKWYSGVLAVAA
jgi:DNA-binding XRE family transcriptional regulator